MLNSCENKNLKYILKLIYYLWRGISHANYSKNERGLYGRSK